MTLLTLPGCWDLLSIPLCRWLCMVLFVGLSFVERDAMAAALEPALADPLQVVQRFEAMADLAIDEYRQRTAAQSEALKPREQAFLRFEAWKNPSLDVSQKVEWSLRLGTEYRGLQLLELRRLRSARLVDRGLWAVLIHRQGNIFSPRVNWREVSKDFGSVYRKLASEIQKDLVQQHHGLWWQWFLNDLKGESALPQGKENFRLGAELAWVGQLQKTGRRAHSWRKLSAAKLIELLALRLELGLEQRGDLGEALVLWSQTVEEFDREFVRAVLGAVPTFSDEASNSNMASVEELFQDLFSRSRNPEWLVGLASVQTRRAEVQPGVMLAAARHLIGSNRWEQAQEFLSAMNVPDEFRSDLDLARAEFLFAKGKAKRDRGALSWASEYAWSAAERGQNLASRDERYLFYAETLEANGVNKEAQQFYRMVFRLATERALRIRALERSVDLHWKIVEQTKGQDRAKELRDYLYHFGILAKAEIRKGHVDRRTEFRNRFRKIRSQVEQWNLDRKDDVLASLNEVEAILVKQR